MGNTVPDATHRLCFLGKWKETILYAFQGGPDGAEPRDDRLAIDAVGSLYGTTVGGGPILATMI